MKYDLRVKYIIPKWCRMHTDDHRFASGCWGISHGFVAKEGRDYCYGYGSICEFAEQEKTTNRFLQKSREHSDQAARDKSRLKFKGEL